MKIHTKLKTCENKIPNLPTSLEQVFFKMKQLYQVFGRTILKPL